MNNPEVVALYICHAQGAPMEYRSAVVAKAGKGLAGDRYHSDIKKGYWQVGVKNPRETIRQVSIISADATDNTDFSAEQTRRNIVVSMSPDELNATVGQEIQIGTVLMRVTELCTPCKHPSEVTGIPDFAKQFKDKGGVRAEILTSGVIYERDPVSIITDETT